MGTLTFLYNIFLIILFSVASTCTFTLYIKSKRKPYLYIALLLLLFILDNTVVYMTEFLKNFSTQYDSSFMNVPAFKTIIVLTTAYLYYTINNEILQVKRKYSDYVVLLAFAIYLLFIPMFPNGALKIWLYYLPAQLYLGFLSLSSLKQIKKEPNFYSDIFYLKYKKLLQLSLLFSIFILIEDTIVIFNYDNYSSILVKINNRSLTQDLLSMIYASIAIVHSFHYFSSGTNLKNNSITDSSFHKDKAEKEKYRENGSVSMNKTILSTITNFEERNIKNNYQEPKELFCEKYQFTNREKDIFHEMLKANNNEEISEDLFISIGTVKTHSHNIYKKVGVNKRTQLVQVYHEEIEKAFEENKH